jgi:hypothetical protein
MWFQESVSNRLLGTQLKVYFDKAWLFALSGYINGQSNNIGEQKIIVPLTKFIALIVMWCTLFTGRD